MANCYIRRNLSLQFYKQRDFEKVIELLEEKGIITKEELLEEIRAAQVEAEEKRKRN